MTTASFLLSAALLFVSVHGRAEVRRLEIPPPLTGAGIRQVTSPHLALRDDAVPASGALVVSIGGTHSRTSDFQHVHRAALAQGHAVLAIDYPNGVISTTCREAAPDCFDRFRAEVATGVPGSDIVEVDSANSVVNRIQALIRFLADRDAAWRPYLHGDGIDWGKVILIGHSQGAGHAAYISKFVALRRLVLFAGPQDATAAAEVAPWARRPGLTPPERIFAFLHAKDFFDAKLQLKVNQALHEGRKPSVRTVTEGRAAGTASVLLSERPAHDGHNAVLHPPNEDVFARLLDAGL